ncbi:Phosphoserine phosphatase [Enhygromyxa salina]|uniref:Phosphoserine phosphatase n=1 Tax=Enhygromyxa salina TaxID=215803 RepID=A0A2S9XDE6_9BACT|nr:HAD family hydrolase [Enhygromyxa salina]PRP90790.1 Phosphoserine phosphatase [Enhygromyxa salina]
MSDTAQTRSAGAVAAFFDVDHTLIACNSARKWIEYLWRNDKISVAAALRSVWWLVKYRMSVLDYEAVTAEVVSGYAGQSVDELCKEVGAWFHAEIEPMICVEGRERVEWHRAQGHLLVLLTSGTFFSVEPLQRILDVPHLVCTQLELVEGKLTGRYHPPSCFGPGKLLAGLAFAENHGIELEQSYFYTDSYSDLPMLERVGHPRVINPDPRLKHWAQSRDIGWEQWHAQGLLEAAAGDPERAPSSSSTSSGGTRERAN